MRQEEREVVTYRAERSRSPRATNNYGGQQPRSGPNAYPPRRNDVFPSGGFRGGEGAMRGGMTRGGGMRPSDRILPSRDYDNEVVVPRGRGRGLRFEGRQ